MLGLTINGGFAQYMKADARVVAKLPDNISFAEGAPLYCAGATVYGGLLAVQPQKGQWIAMVGIGGLGHLGVQYAKAMGLKVVAIDNRQEGIDLLKDLPEHLRADKTYVIGDEDAKKKCIEELQTGFYDTNPGVDRVVINTEEPTLIKFSQQLYASRALFASIRSSLLTFLLLRSTSLRKGGILCDVGLPSDSEFSVDPFALNFKEQTVKGRLICTPEQCQDMVNLHSENGCKTYIEKTYGVDQINEMIEHYKRKDLQGRLVMTFE